MTPSQQWKKELPTRPFSIARTIKLAASAGCGKTYSIERTITELMEDGVRPSAIMYVVFNKKPALEFRARYPQFGSDDMQWWNTHHSINKRLLGLSPMFGRYKAMGQPGSSLWCQFSEEYGYEFTGEDDADGYSETPHGTELLTAVSLAFDNGGSEETLDEEERKFLADLRQFEDDNKVLSFFSMMHYALAADLFPPGIEYVFVDEAQDNSRAQNDYWLRMLSSHTGLKGFMLAGDDKQAINRYKGGYAEGFLEFPVELQVSLGASHRCPTPVLRLANDIAFPIEPRSPLVETSLSPNRGSVVSADSLTDIIDDLQEYVKKNKTILVLSRHKKLAESAKARLGSAGIPIASEVADRIRRILRSFNDMRVTGTITSSDMELLSPLRPAGTKTKDGELKATCPYFDKQMRKEMRKEESQHLTAAQASFLAEAEERSAFPIPLTDATQVGFTSKFVVDVMDGVPPLPEYFYGGENAASRVEDVRDWLRLYGHDYAPAKASTIHTAKGGEADVVVLLRDVYRSQAAREEFESDDERRVWYTAATRSRDVLIITKLNKESERNKMTSFL